MKALRRVEGVAAVLDRADADTDQIIPKQFLKRIERTGFGEFLFFDWAKEPSFGDIFRTNSLKIGLLPIVLPHDDVRTLMESGGKTVVVDVEARTVTDASGRTIPFDLDDFHRERLLEGLDDIGLTLRREAEIAAFERGYAAPVDTSELVAVSH